MANNYIAVHIRRTDHADLAKKHNTYTSDIDFFTFIDACQSTKNLYIATDNKHTYDEFEQKYNTIVNLPYHEVVCGGFRETSLRDAVIDLFMCVRAHSFKGSGYSSFSDLIDSLRLIPNI